MHIWQTHFYVAHRTEADKFLNIHEKHYEKESFSKLYITCFKIEVFYIFERNIKQKNQ